MKNFAELDAKICSCTDALTAKLDGSNGKRAILLCGGTGCISSNSLEIKAKFEKLVVENNLQDKVSVNIVGCFGFCSQGPFVKIFPEDTLYRLVTLDDVDEIFEKDIKGGEIIERLLYIEPNTGKKVAKQDDINFYKKQKRVALHGGGVINPEIIRDTSKCILCGRCVARCKNAHGEDMGILGFENRGFNTIVAPAENRSFLNSPCIQCGQCVSVCPTGALMEKSEIGKVDAAFKAGKHVVVQTAPAVRAALGEEFGMPVGTPVTGKMVAALKRLGFHKVYDTNFAADLTIMEEGTELLSRIQNGGKLPMITSCSPGWINYAEYNYGDLLPHLSTCKSPHQMQGAIIKSYYAQKKGMDPKDIFVVSIMPCTAKKDEAQRDQLKVDELADVDAVLTTRELAKMIKRAGILFTRLPDEEFDQDLMGEYTGAGVIFGVTGGVMEAALRTVYFVLTGKEHEAIKFEAVRGFEGVREASVEINGMTVNVAIAHGMKNAKVLLDEIREGKSKYHFIEIMGCPGGCIAGGGQPIVRSCFLPNEDDDIQDTFRAKRAAALYSEDERQVLRQSHNNPQIKQLYDEFLGAPNSHKAHHLLHTTYEAREGFND